MIFDLGANIGIWTRVFASRVATGRVYAFEPSPRNFEMLEENAKIHDNIICINLACSDKTGQVRLSIAGTSGLHHVAAGDAADTIEVAAVRLDDWVACAQLERLDFMKIDVEVHEAGVLLGARETIRIHRPIVLFEYLPEFVYRSDHAGSFPFDFFGGMGYSIVRLDKSGVLHRRTGADLPPDWTNDYVAYDPDRALSAALKDILVA